MRTTRGRRAFCTCRKTPTRRSSGWRSGMSSGEKDHPIFWWEARIKPAPTPGAHWMPVMSDPTWRAKYADAIADLLTRWDAQQFRGWIDNWSAQIAADVAADPHTWPTRPVSSRRSRQARAIVETRPAYLRTFVECDQERVGSGQRRRRLPLVRGLPRRRGLGPHRRPGDLRQRRRRQLQRVRGRRLLTTGADAAVSSLRRSGA